MKKYNLTYKKIYFAVFGLLLGLIALQKSTHLFDGINPIVFTILAIVSVLIALNLIKVNDKNSLFKNDDELSLQIKFKSGYYSYFASMYMWILVLLFKDMFANTEALLITGVLLSAVIGLVSNLINRKYVGE